MGSFISRIRYSRLPEKPPNTVRNSMYIANKRTGSPYGRLKRPAPGVVPECRRSNDAPLLHVRHSRKSRSHAVAVVGIIANRRKSPRQRLRFFVKTAVFIRSAEVILEKGKKVAAMPRSPARSRWCTRHSEKEKKRLLLEQYLDKSTDDVEAARGRVEWPDAIHSAGRVAHNAARPALARARAARYGHGPRQALGQAVARRLEKKKTREPR